jgi:hypothetical protein
LTSSSWEPSFRIDAVSSGTAYWILTQTKFRVTPWTAEQ